MKQEELTKTFMMISNRKNFWSPWFIWKYFNALSIKYIVPLELKVCTSHHTKYEIHPFNSRPGVTYSQFVFSNAFGLFLVLLNCFYCMFCHLKLEFLTQFPTSNEKNIFIYFFKYTSSKLSCLTNWASTTNYIIHFSDILFGLKSVWNCIYTDVAGPLINTIL